MDDLEELEELNTKEASDQYCQYGRLPVLLKRFSFSEKMRMASIDSSHAILFGKNMQKESERTHAFPWCLETFVMLAMEAQEYASGDFRGKNKRKFIKMCDAIWNAPAIVTQLPCGRFDFLDVFMAVTALNQFQIQESPWIRKYRYWQIFNNDSAPVQLKTLFAQKMGAPYEDFMLLGHVLQVLFIAQANSKAFIIPTEALRYLLYIRFPEAAKQLKITRSEYVALQQKFAEDSDDPYRYVYSLCPSYQYAFVEEGSSIYFPLPHLLNQCVTSSLLYRLTEGDNDLRDQIGKHVWENYLLKLIAATGVYQEVFPEQPYTYLGSDSHSPDVLARQGNNVLFIDSKSTVPALGIRLFNPDSYEDNIRIIAENIKKIYNQLHRFNHYNPFSGEVSSDKNDYWGIVVVLEDAYIKRARYFEAARELLKIQSDSAEWFWMISHIRVMSLYEIERICLGGNSIIDACRETAKDDYFNFAFTGYPPNGSTFANENYRVFREMYDSKVMGIIEDMKNQGALS